MDAKISSSSFFFGTADALGFAFEADDAATLAIAFGFENDVMAGPLLFFNCSANNSSTVGACAANGMDVTEFRAVLGAIGGDFFDFGSVDLALSLTMAGLGAGVDEGMDCSSSSQSLSSHELLSWTKRGQYTRTS